MTQFNESLRIGIIGGGQLGRMLIQAAQDWNLNISVLDPDPAAPCSRMVPDFVQGSLTDFDTVYAFGSRCDVLTIEIENINIAALIKLQAEGKAVYPQPEIVEMIQDKRLQKAFYAQHNLPTSPFTLTDNAEAVRQYAAQHGFPFVNKLGRGGYDGRGVSVIRSESDLDQAFDAPSLVEAFVPFEKELAVIVARNPQGETQVFPSVEMVFHPTANLVEFLFAPADIDEALAAAAENLAQDVIESLGLVGVLAVEMFLTTEGKLLVNEIAPRPHNSGHHTIRANATSQYEQHWRAILGLPLGDTQVNCLAGMVNLLGAEGHSGVAHYEGFAEILGISGVYPMLYGKTHTKPFRKMGHVTLLADSLDELQANAARVRKTLRVVAKG